MSNKSGKTIPAQSAEDSAEESVQDSLQALYSRTEEKVRSKFHALEENVCASPTASVLTATAAGYLLHLLPLRAILVTNVRVVSALLPPGLVILGAVKAYEFFQRQASPR
jgi:hypothetical protein